MPFIDVYAASGTLRADGKNLFLHYKTIEPFRYAQMFSNEALFISFHFVPQRLFVFHSPSRQTWFSINSVQFVFTLHAHLLSRKKVKKKKTFLPNDRADHMAYGIDHYEFYIIVDGLENISIFAFNALKCVRHSWNRLISTSGMRALEIHIKRVKYVSSSIGWYTFFFIRSTFPVRPGSSSSCQWRWRLLWKAMNSLKKLRS